MDHPLFQDLSNFVDRCYAIAMNTVQQLASLYRAKDPLYETIFKSVDLLPVYR